MKKSGAPVVVLILIFLNIWISFGDDTIQKLELGEDQIVALSEGWTYVDAFWVKPDALDSVVGKSNYSLDKLGENDLENKARGTLFKAFIIPESLVGKPLIINNTLFDETFDLYIDGMYYEKSISISKHQKVEDGYLFIPNDSQIVILIHFEQGSNQITRGSSLYLGSLSAYERHQHFVWLSDNLVLAFTLVFFMFLIWQRVSGQVKVKGIIFELLVIAFILNFAISEIEQTFIFSHFEFIRVQFFLFAFISTLFATYGYEGNGRFMPFAKEFGKIYLILFAASVTIIPIHYMHFIWYGHLVLILVYVLVCNKYEMQWKRNVAFAYFLVMAYLNWNGVLDSSLSMLPILIILIYGSFSRTGEREQISKADNIVPLKESYGSDKTEIQLKEMVNVIEEGLVVLTSDLYIDHAYNETMKTFFDTDIKHRKITDIIYQDDFDNKLYAETILGRYFESETESDKMLYLDLLSSKVIINGRVLSLKYKISKDPKYLVAVLVDQTESQKMFDEKESLQKKLDMLLEIVRNQTEFKQLYQEFIQFLHQDMDNVVEKSHTINHYIDNILLNLDYFEKQFFKFRLLKVTASLQKIISELSALKKEGGFTNVSDVKRYLETFDLDELLSGDLETLESVLNEDVMKQEHLILVEESDFIELEKKLANLPGHEKVTELVLKMKHAQNQKLIKKYDQYISELARKLGKKVNPIVLEGYDSVLNNENCSGILKSMVYLIDNAIIHGIEKPSDRFRKNKSEYGTVKVKFRSLEAFVEITFEDDGQGIDYNGIKDMLYQQKKVPFETLVLLDSETLSDYLFEEGVTTNVENYSGIGLAQLKKEVNLQKGSLKIESKLNQFTRIIIRVPE